MWIRDYEEVCKNEEKFGGVQNLGASESEILAISDILLNKFGIDLPNELKDVYRITAGFEANGHILYGIDEEFLLESPKHHITGIVEMNLIWKDNKYDDYLFIAHHDLSWFVYSTTEKLYKELDLPSGTPITDYINLNDLLTVFFKRSLEC